MPATPDSGKLQTKRISVIGLLLALAWTILLAGSCSWYYWLHSNRLYQEAQSYREGDSRGSTGRIASASDLLKESSSQTAGSMFVHGLVWIVGLGLLWVGTRKLTSSVSALQQSEEALRLQAIQLTVEASERRNSDSARQESERFLRTIIETEPECVKLLAPDGSLLMMNSAGLAMIQADSFDQVKGQCVLPLVVPEHRENFRNKVAEVFQGKPNSFEFEIVGLKGERVWLETRAVPFRDEHETIISLLAITRDITLRKQQEKQLRDLSLVDELTGLTNRRGFMHLARQQMKLADRNKTCMALVFIDLDRMKAINDTFGHGAGDRAIIDTAMILRNSFRASDIIARIGGDEFVAFSVEASADAEEQIRGRLMENLYAHNLDAEGGYKLSISFGITIYDPAKPVLLEELLEQSDRLMYEQKRKKVAVPSPLTDTTPQSPTPTA